MTTTADREIVVTRVLNAPRALVYEAFTDPKHVAKWWSPPGFTMTTHEMDVRPGGVWRTSLSGPYGTFDSTIAYIEVVKPERLVYDYGVGDNDPNPVRTTVIFEDEGDKTNVTMQLVFPSAEVRDTAMTHGAVEGASQALDRAEEYVASLA